MESRSFPVPPGAAGERVDVALARILGFSRSFAADVVDAGGVVADGLTLAKSDRLGTAPARGHLGARVAPAVIPLAVPDLHIIHQDEDIIVVDKPVGVAAHPAMGWTGPTVLGALAAAGLRVSTLARRNGPASSTASTWERAASWSSRRANAHTPN